MQPVDRAQERLGRAFRKPLAKAMRASWNPEALVRAWGETRPQTKMTKQQAAQWVRTHINFNRGPVRDALASLYSVATVFGIDSANYRMKQAQKRNKADGDQQFNFNWANWRPGNRAAAVLVNPKGGLAKRLAERNRTIKGIEDTTIDRIGGILAKGLEEGLSSVDVVGDVAGELIDARTDWAETLEERLKQLADDERRAEVIAKTEMNRAIWDEQVDRYSSMGVEKYEWLVLTPCDDCLINDGAVVAIGEPFPNGWIGIDDSHPNCNCTLAPYFDDEFQEEFPEYDRFGQPVDDIEMSASATVGKYSDDQPRDEHGRFGSGGGGESKTLTPREPLTGHQIIGHTNTIKEAVSKYRAESKDLDNPHGMMHTEYEANAIQEALGVGGRPTLVDDATKLTGEPIYRGVGFMQEENLEKATDNLKTGDVAWQGYGVFGSGLYFTNQQDIADKYGQKNSEFSTVYTAALSPDANVVTFADWKEYRNATAELATTQLADIKSALDEKYGANDSPEKSAAFDSVKEAYPGIHYATNMELENAHINWLLKGVDAVNIGRSDKYDRPVTYTVVFNREALQVVK